MKRLAILALLLTLAGSGTAEAWPCWMVRGYAAAKGLGPPLTAEKERRIKALVQEHNVSPEEQQRYAACFVPEAKKNEQAQTPNVQGPTVQKHRRAGRAQRVPNKRRKVKVTR